MNGIFVPTPYKGYHGRAELHDGDECYNGELVGIRDTITFVGKTPKELQQAFHESVDDYLAWCRKRGKDPNKPFSGNFMVRMTPELHRSLSQFAESHGRSLNSFVVDCLADAIAVRQPVKSRRKAV